MPLVHPAVTVPYDRAGYLVWFALVPLEMLLAYALRFAATGTTAPAARGRAARLVAGVRHWLRPTRLLIAAGLAIVAAIGFGTGFDSAAWLVAAAGAGAFLLTLLIFGSREYGHTIAAAELFFIGYIYVKMLRFSRASEAISGASSLLTTVILLVSIGGFLLHGIVIYQAAFPNRRPGAARGEERRRGRREVTLFSSVIIPLIVVLALILPPGLRRAPHRLQRAQRAAAVAAGAGGRLQHRAARRQPARPAAVRAAGSSRRRPGRAAEPAGRGRRPGRCRADARPGGDPGAGVGSAPAAAATATTAAARVGGRGGRRLRRRPERAGPGGRWTGRPAQRRQPGRGGRRRRRQPGQRRRRRREPPVRGDGHRQPGGPGVCRRRLLRAVRRRVRLLLLARGAAQRPGAPPPVRDLGESRAVLRPRAQSHRARLLLHHPGTGHGLPPAGGGADRAAAPLSPVRPLLPGDLPGERSRSRRLAPGAAPQRGRTRTHERLPGDTAGRGATGAVPGLPRRVRGRRGQRLRQDRPAHEELRQLPVRNRLHRRRLDQPRRRVPVRDQVRRLHRVLQYLGDPGTHARHPDAGGDRLSRLQVPADPAARARRRRPAPVDRAAAGLPAGGPLPDHHRAPPLVDPVLAPRLRLDGRSRPPPTPRRRRPAWTPTRSTS